MIFSEHRAAPVIETDRLRLRPHTLADYDHLRALWSDTEVTRFIGGRPQTDEEVWHRLLRYAGMWRLIGIGFWAVEDRETRTFLGDIGLMDARRPMNPPLGDVPEIGWSFMPAAQGRGFAREAVGATIAWADQQLTAPELVCIIHPDNTRSISLAERYGFRERLRTTYHGAPTIQFERPLKASTS